MTTPRQHPADQCPAASGGEVPAHLDPAATPELLAEDSTLFSLLRGIASTSGEECFRAITRNLAAALDVSYAVVADFRPQTRTVHTLAFWAKDHFEPNIEWALAGTPCEHVINGRFSLHPSGLREAFPLDTPLVALGAESYLGVPLLDGQGQCLGHLFVMDTKPMPAVPRNLAVFRVFSARATSELLRLRAVAALAASEVRFKTVVDMAMDAIVAIDGSMRVAIFNTAAEGMFRCGRADAVGRPIGRFLSPALDELLHGYLARPEEDSSERFFSLPGGLSARRADGEVFPVEGTLARSRASDLALVTVTLRDVSEREKTTRRIEQLKQENTYLKEQAGAPGGAGTEIVGSSAALARVLQAVKVVAPTDSTVLIQGETGTGKELIARAVHDQSERRSAAFVKVNCAALPAGLVESEFFGHEKGAFTGAVGSRRGRFELADGGTIFLDEVGEVSPDVQVKLLRVLQESEFERVGGSETVRVNVRVIAATNRDLAADVQSQRFRADLYYRLSVFPIQMPPLRDRASDIGVLASYFVTNLAATIGKRIDQIEPATLKLLQEYAWPGNIRELRNVLERAVILSTGATLRIDPSDLGSPGERHANGVAGERSAMSLADMEREHILRVLKQTGGAIAGPAGAARVLGVPPSTLRSRMARLGLKA